MATVPADLLRRLAERVGPVVGSAPVGGGCVGDSFRVDLDGATCFLKLDRRGPAGFFAAEAAGLQALAAATHDLRVPRVLDFEDAGPSGGWIALEWLEPAPAGATFWRDLGIGLATIHRHTRPRWGWDRGGYIGSLAQDNTPSNAWSSFWIDRRIRPQLALAESAGTIRRTDGWDRLLHAMPDLLAPADADGPSLLHGDLWAGNVLATSDGPAIIDPAVYFGHREIDLAMADLFGGFHPDFFAAYHATWPLASGYEIRRKVYQLYYLLVHVNLFGAGYAASTRSTLRSILRAL